MYNTLLGAAIEYANNTCFESIVAKYFDIPYKSIFCVTENWENQPPMIWLAIGDIIYSITLSVGKERRNETYIFIRNTNALFKLITY